MSTTPLAEAGRPATDPRDRSTTVRRVAALTRANALLMVRNRLTLIYATVFPLVPMALLIANPGDAETGVTAVVGVLFLALLFPVYYNVLSLFVTRRDELVLKRLRTGEARDGEQLAALALPGSAVALVIIVATIGVGAIFDLPLPANPLLFIVGGLLGIAIFVGLAFATAAFTKTAEAAQITSLPVMVLATVGTLVAALPDGFARVVEWTPIAAMDALTRATWLDADGSIAMADTWRDAADPLSVLVIWTVLAVVLGKRYLRWEPRA
jgi:ABC-2 type transport system permease protein